MTQILDPNAARQRFYSKALSTGCALVCFYNHSQRTFTADEIEQLKGCAAEHYDTVPMERQGTLLAWVEITDTSLRVGEAMLTEPGSSHIVPCGYHGYDAFNGSVNAIMQGLKEYAEAWRTRVAKKALVDPRDSAAHHRDVLHLAAEQEGDE